MGTLGTTSAPTFCNSSIASLADRFGAAVAFFEEVVRAAFFGDVAFPGVPFDAAGAAALAVAFAVLAARVSVSFTADAARLAVVAGLFVVERVFVESPPVVAVSFFFLIAIQLPYCRFTYREKQYARLS
jgi:hypothetical protein